MCVCVCVCVCVQGKKRGGGEGEKTFAYVKAAWSQNQRVGKESMI